VDEEEYSMKFDLNKPRRRCFNSWIEDLQKLSGVRDVSQDDLDDAAIQAAFADDPARRYAEAEMADGRHREQFPNDPSDC
jgi:hypothetical protein